MITNQVTVNRKLTSHTMSLLVPDRKLSFTAMYMLQKKNPSTHQNEMRQKTITEFEEYISSRENPPGYVDLYTRECCKKFRLNLKITSDSDIHKRFVIDKIITEPNVTTTSGDNNGLKIYTFNIVKSQMSQTNMGAQYEPPYQTMNSIEEGANDTSAPEVKILDLPASREVNAFHVSPFSTWLYVFNPDRPLGSQVESLDALLRAIDKFASNDQDEDFSDCTFVVFTHRSTEHEQVVLDQIQKKHTCKYVYKDIFVLDTELDSLKEKLILTRKFEIQAQWTWFKLVTDILQFCADKERAYISLHEVERQATRQYQMSSKTLRDLLHYFRQHNDIIFDDKILDLLQSGSICKKSATMLITDPVFLDKIYRELVEFSETRNTPSLRHQDKQEVNQDFKEGVISANTLKLIWKGLDKSIFNSLVDIFVRYGLFIEFRCPESKTFNRKYIVPAIKSQNCSESLTRIFPDRDLSPLVYWFAQSSDPHHREVSGIHTEDILFQLVASLKDLLPEHGYWTYENMSSQTAEFRVGPEGQFLVTISSHGCALVVKLGYLPDEITDQPANLIPEIRCWFKSGIQDIISKDFSNMHCTVYVSPCRDGITPNHVKFECLQRLGSLGLTTKQLPLAICKVHSKTLGSLAFREWFCADASQQKILRDSFRSKTQEQEDTRILRQLAKKVGNEETLHDLADALGLAQREIDIQMTNSNGKIGIAAFSVLYRDWYSRNPGFLVEGSDKYNELMKAMEKAGLAIYTGFMPHTSNF